MSQKCEKLVVDSGAIIKWAAATADSQADGTQLWQMAEQYYTIAEVVNELRDPVTRQRLSTLPIDLHILQPSPDAIKTGTLYLIYV